MYVMQSFFDQVQLFFFHYFSLALSLSLSLSLCDQQSKIVQSTRYAERFLLFVSLSLSLSLVFVQYEEMNNDPDRRNKIHIFFFHLFVRVMTMM